VRLSDPAIAAAAIVMGLAAVLRAGALLHASIAAESEPVPAAKALAVNETSRTQVERWPRPLFSISSAKPQADATSGAMTAAEPGSQLPRLLGIIIDQNNRTAIFGYGGKVQHLQEDGRIGAWTVAHIDQRSVVLQNTGEEQVIKLDAAAR
jgi:type II secretory pathway component PulC